MFGIANNTEFLTAIGIANAPEETKARIVAGIEELAQKQLIIRLSERLTDAQAEEFGAITDEKQAADWLMANVPDLQQIVTDIMANIRDDILQHKAVAVGQEPKVQ